MITVVVDTAGLVYVTGISGAGKSTVCAELRRRGYDAHDGDEDDNAVWVDRVTGEVIARADSATRRAPGFLDRYEWRFDVGRVRALAHRAEDHLVFLCGAAANEVEVWPLFACTIYLAIDDGTLRHRLASRTTNDFGRSDHERDMVLGWHDVAEEDYRRFGPRSWTEHGQCGRLSTRSWWSPATLPGDRRPTFRHRPNGEPTRRRRQRRARWENATGR